MSATAAFAGMAALNMNRLRRTAGADWGTRIITKNVNDYLLPVGDLDLFVHENIAYAAGLVDADVPTGLHVFTGAYHGFDFCGTDLTLC